MGNNEKIAWAAGILEGEGCFSIHKRKDRPNTIQCAIHCEMTDQEPVMALKYSVFRVGTVCERENIRKDGRIRKPSWIWSVQKKEDILYVLALIRRYIRSSRRKEKIEDMIGVLVENQ